MTDDTTGAASLDIGVDTGLLFPQAMAQTRMAICLTDPRRDDNPIVFVNRAFLELTGYAESELLGHNCRMLQGPETDEATLDVLRRAIAEEDVVVVELTNYRRDGTAFWNALHLGPIHDEHGELLYFFGSQWDVTALRAARAEEHLARMFVRELSHRMKNMFAVIAGVVTLSAEDAGVPRVADAINERIAAIGRAHEEAFAAEDDEQVELGRVSRLTLAPFMETTPERIVIRGEKVMLASGTVSLIGLALHELAANAVKHGALSDPEGRIELDWAFDKDHSFVLQWRERLPENTRVRERSGSGAGIVAELVDAAGGRLDRHWRDDGLSVRFTLPLDGLRREPERSGTPS